MEYICNSEHVNGFNLQMLSDEKFKKFSALLRHFYFAAALFSVLF